jgi:putative oxidoreductase
LIARGRIVSSPGSIISPERPGAVDPGEEFTASPASVHATPGPSLKEIVMSNATLSQTSYAPTGHSGAKPLVPAFATLQNALSPFAEVAVRVTTGAFLLPHGAQKLFGLFGGYGVEATGQFFASKLGLPASFALVAGLIEFFGGLALALGLFTRPAAALVFVLMAVAVVQVHLANGYFWTNMGFEYPLMWAILALSFVVRGGGRYSVDAAIGREI